MLGEKVRSAKPFFALRNGRRRQRRPMEGRRRSELGHRSHQRNPLAALRNECAPASLLPLTIAAPKRKPKSRAKRYESFIKRMARLSEIVIAESPRRARRNSSWRGDDGAGAGECDRPRRGAGAA